MDGLRSLEAARKQIVELLEARGLIEKIEPTTHVVPHGDRSGAVLEPFLTDQWYVDAKTLAQAGDRGGARTQDRIRAGAVGSDLLQLDGEYPAVVHFAANLVGPSDSGLVRPGWQRLFVAETRRMTRSADALAHYGEIEEIIGRRGIHDIAADPERRDHASRANTS